MALTTRAETAMQKAILMIENGFEQRVPDADTVAFIQDGTEQCVPASELLKLKKGSERPISIASYAKHSTTIRTARAITAATPDSTTMAQQLSWSTVGFHVDLAPIESDEQIDNAVMDFKNKLKSGIRSAVLDMTTKGNTWLEASKTTVFAAAPEISGITVGASSIDVLKTSFFESLPVYMRKQALTGDFDLLTNIGFMQIENEYKKYGAGNSQNLGQFLNGINPYYASSLVPAAGDKIKAYAKQRGTTGMVTWIEEDAKRNINTDVVSYYQQPLTFTTLNGKAITFNFGVMEQSAPKDLSARVAGGQRAYRTEYGFYFDYAFVKTQSSTAGDTPITKVTSLL